VPSVARLLVSADFKAGRVSVEGYAVALAQVRDDFGALRNRGLEPSRAEISGVSAALNRGTESLASHSRAANLARVQRTTDGVSGWNWSRFTATSPRNPVRLYLLSVSWDKPTEPRA